MRPRGTGYVTPQFCIVLTHEADWILRDRGTHDDPTINLHNVSMVEGVGDVVVNLASLSLDGVFEF
jgi:hypothetical protein